MTDHEFEYRCYPTGAPEVRKSITGRTIGGYAAKFGVKSHKLDYYKEVVEPQAFRKSQSDGWPGVICRYNHEDNMLLGTTAAGTLQLSLDDIGLDYTVDIPECRSDVLEMVQRKDITKSSFAFQCFDQEFSRGDGDIPIRHLLQCRLIDVSPVTRPAYEDSSVGLRALAIQFGEDPEEIFRMGQAHELRKLWDLSGGPKMPAREALKQVGRDGKAALELVRAAAPGRAARERLLETLAQSLPPHVRVELDSLPSEITPLEAARQELAEARAEIARLCDPGIVAAELTRPEAERAETLARDDVARLGPDPLSGAAALRLTMDASATALPYQPLDRR